ncbi:hypothetical protein V8F33_008734 [Rhypophila sp. PSN 637]
MVNSFSNFPAGSFETMANTRQRSSLFLPSLSPLFPQSSHWHFTAATTRLGASSLFSVVVITSVLVLKSLIVLVTSGGPMQARSKIPVAVNSPTRSPDKISPPSSFRGLPPKGSKRSFDSISSTETKPKDKDEQQGLVQTSDEPLKSATRSKLPCPSSSKTGSGAQLRRSSQRIPERQADWVVPFPVSKEMSRPGQTALLGNPDKVDFDSRPVTRHSQQVNKAEPDIERQDVLPEATLEEDPLDQLIDLFDEPHARYPRLVTGTTAESTENLSSHKPSLPKNVRPFLSRSGFSARMDTISEHSAESEISNKPEEQPRSVSVSHLKGYRVVDGLLPVIGQDEEPRGPPPHAPPPPPAPPSPPMPSPAPAAVVERTSTDALSLNADVKATQDYMEGFWRDNLSTGGNSKGSPDSSLGSIDSGLDGSIKSPESPESPKSPKSFSDLREILEADLKATRKILASLPVPPLSTYKPPRYGTFGVFDTSKASLSTPFGSREETMDRTHKFLLQNEGEAMRREWHNEMGLAAFFTYKDEPIELTKEQHSFLTSGPGEIKAEEVMKAWHNWCAANNCPPIPAHTKDQDGRADEADSDGPAHTQDRDGRADDTPDSNDVVPPDAGHHVDSSRADDKPDSDGVVPPAAGRHVDSSRAANLTHSLVSALDSEESSQTQSQSTNQDFSSIQDSSCSWMEDPIMSLITAYREEEENLWPLLVGFTCDPRAAQAVSWVYPTSRKSFKRVQPPVLSFGLQVQRYCLMYVPGFDMREAVRKLQGRRERRGMGSSLGSSKEPRATGGLVKRAEGGAGYRSLLDVKIPRSCGCDTGRTQCAHAGSSNAGSLRTSIHSWAESTGAEDDNRSDGVRRDEMPLELSSPPTPPRAKERADGDQELHLRLPNFGLWKRRPSQDKGKGKAVERPPETTSPDSKLSPQQHVAHKDSASSRAELTTASPEARYQPSPARSSTMASNFRSSPASTGGTPSTPRTHFSSQCPEKECRPATPRPLTDTESLVIQDALSNATDAITSMHDFMLRLQESYHLGQPRAELRFQQGYPSANPYGPSYTEGVVRTQAQREAFARYQDLVRSSPNHVTAAVMVLEEQTKAIKRILDAIQPEDTKADSRPAQKESGKTTYFTSLLKSVSKNDEDVSSTKKGAEELKMTGGLPKPSGVHVRSGAATSEDKQDAAEAVDRIDHEPPRQVFSKLAASHSVRDRAMNVPAIHDSSADKGPSTPHPKPTGADLRVSASQNPTESLEAPKLSLPRLKLSFTGLRARHVACVQLAKFARLDTYNYRFFTSLGERIDRFEEKLWALENQRQNSVSSGDSFESGSRGSDKAGLLKADRVVLTDPWSGAMAARNTSGRRASPWHSAESSSVSPRSHGNSPLSSGGVRNFSIPCASSQAKTGRKDNSPKKGCAESTGKEDKWIAKTREAIREMRQTTDTMMQTIIARRPRKIGIVDTEERLNLSSREWDQWDSTTGQLIQGRASGTRLARASTGAESTGSGSSGEDGERLRIRHSASCRYGGGGMQAGIGLGIVDLGHGSRTKVLGEKPHPGSNGRSTRESSTASIPLDAGNPPHLQCPDCGVELVPSVRKKTEAPNSRGGLSQIAWVSKVMGPLGRKRAGQYSVYPQSFGAQEKVTHVDEYVEQDKEWDGDDDLSSSSREQRGRQARRRSASAPVAESAYDRLTGRGEGLALLRFRNSAPAQVHLSPRTRRDKPKVQENDMHGGNQWGSFESQGHQGQAGSVDLERHITIIESTRRGRDHDVGIGRSLDRVVDRAWHDRNSSTDDDSGLETQRGGGGKIEEPRQRERRLARPKSHNALMGHVVGVGLALGGPDDSGLGMTPSPSTDSSRPDKLDSSASEREPLLARLGWMVNYGDRSRTM